MRWGRVAKDVAVEKQIKYRPRIAQNLLGGVGMQSKGAVHLQRWGHSAKVGTKRKGWGGIAKASAGWGQNAKDFVSEQRKRTAEAVLMRSDITPFRSIG